jgi:hypothetical protein
MRKALNAIAIVVTNDIGNGYLRGAKRCEGDGC